MARDPAYPVRKLIGFTEEQAERIADFRHSRRINTESEAIRQLIESGLRLWEAGLET